MIAAPRVLGVVSSSHDGGRSIVLDINAEPGSGSLLGSLLCALAGLLDGSNNALLANLLNLRRADELAKFPAAVQAR